MVRGSSTDGTGSTHEGTTGAPAYRERVLPSAGSWVAAPALAALSGLAAAPLGLGVVALVVLAVVGLVAVVLLAWSPVVEVSGGELRAGRARIPLSELGAATGYDGEDARQQRGPALDARAHVLMRGWADGVVRVEVTDPEDPAPYWLVSTHRPRRLAAVLQPRG